MNPTARLAQYAAELRYQHLPADVAMQAQQSLLDVLGVALAGSGLGEGLESVGRYASAALGRGPSPVWATGEMLAPGAAALVNGVHARALDFDDIIEFPQIHVAACVVPAVLAVLPLAHAPVTGQSLITAVAVGCEVQSRLAAALAPYFGGGLPVMLSSQVFGYFSAALACGSVLGLDEGRMSSALGLAQMQATGTEEMVVHATASIGKALYAGLSNQGGVQAALMAMHGSLAQGEPIAGSAGLAKAFYGGNLEVSCLVDGLGTDYVSRQRCTKALPGTLVGHAFVEAALALLDEHGLAAADVARIELSVGPWGNVMCEPADVRRHPPSASAAMNSIPYVVAKAMACGRVDIGDFGTEARADPATRAIAARIDHVLDSSLARPQGLEPGVVAFVLADGTRRERRIDAPLGHPSRPLSNADVARKFRGNARFAAKPLSGSRVDRLVACVESLATLDDVSALWLRLLPDES